MIVMEMAEEVFGDARYVSVVEGVHGEARVGDLPVEGAITLPRSSLISRFAGRRLVGYARFRLSWRSVQ